MRPVSGPFIRHSTTGRAAPQGSAPCADLALTSATPPLFSIPTTLDADNARGEVHVLTVERLQLAAAQTGVQRRRPQRAVLRTLQTHEHRVDLLGGGKPCLAAVDG